MRRFERTADGRVEAQLEPDEVTLLQSLAGQVAELIAGVSINEDGTASFDAAIARLLPDAYPEDAEASAEFRRFTQSGLADRKVANAETVIRSLDGADITGSVALDEPTVLSWLRCLTDIRLTIASRLGIETEDDDAGRTIDPLMRELYDWLGFVQNSLIEALDDRSAHG